MTTSSQPIRRALVPADAEAVAALTARCEEYDTGEALVELDDIVADWGRPSFALDTDTLGVFETDRLVAYGEVYRGRRAEVYVHPDHRGRGLGTGLMRWTWERARSVGGALVGQTVPDTNTGAVDLFVRNGYRQVWTSWILGLPPGGRIPDVPAPAGVTVRPFRPGEEERVVFETIEDAFNEWPDREPTAYGDWAAGVLGRNGFEAAHLLVAVESAPDGPHVVGACHWYDSEGVGWINQVAVRRDRRGRGLAQLLLRAAFTAAADRGATRSELSTDSRTGALGLYRHVGMEVRQSFTHYALDL